MQQSKPAEKPSKKVEMSTSFLKLSVTIKIPKRNRNKYEVNYETGRIRLGRILLTSTRYPDDYGFIDNSLGLDGDPLDALVLLGELTFPSCVTACRTLGMFRVSDEHGRNDKVLCVPAEDQRTSWHIGLEDVNEFHRLGIQHSFEVYKDLEPGKSVKDADWVGHAEAEKEILASLARFREKEDPGAYTYIHR